MSRFLIHTDTTKRSYSYLTTFIRFTVEGRAFLRSRKRQPHRLRQNQAQQRCARPDYVGNSRNALLRFMWMARPQFCTRIKEIAPEYCSAPPALLPYERPALAD